MNSIRRDIEFDTHEQLRLSLAGSHVRLLNVEEPPANEDRHLAPRIYSSEFSDHANAQRIEIEIRYGKNQFRMRVRDDGKGIDSKVFEESWRPGPWGLLGVRERAQRIGSQLDFWSQPAAGTEVELVIPAAIAYSG